MTVRPKGHSNRISGIADRADSYFTGCVVLR